MEEAIIITNFPRGQLPLQGFRCRRCGMEVIMAGEAVRGEQLADRLGLYDLPRGRRRKLQKHGNSTTVSLDPDFLRRHGKKAGDTVLVAERGDELVIVLD